MANETILKKLLKAREDLLDITARNRLLNTPQRASSWGVRVVDANANRVFANLVEQQKRLRFTALANEDVAEEEIGTESQGRLFDHPMDASAGAYRDDLPVQLDAEKLEKKLLKLQYDARTFEEEQGVNILYLALGFLTWFEADHSDRPRRAPLILVPVVLDRTSVTSRFGLRWSEDDISENLTLKVKLKQEFGLTLPEIEDGEELDVAEYFRNVERCIGDKLEWSVQPNEILLWFFSFAKYLMYRDLDPENWPEGCRIDSHPLIGALLDEGFRDAPPICGNDEPIDDLIPAIDMVHILDADSSQCVVIEEAKRGRNLVVQGPPGTGKSQTITNVIAGAVEEGKKVLFVSEKMAALEVVRSNFERVKLGDICLELHSHKVNKKAVLQDLAAALRLGAPKYRDVEARAEELQLARDRLNRHARELHHRLDPAGVSPFQIIGRITKLHSKGVAASDLVCVDAVGWDASRFNESRRLIHDIALHIEKLGTPSQHIWRGVHLESPPLPTDLERYAKAIGKIIERLDPLIEALTTLTDLLCIQRDVSFSESAIMLRVAQHLVNAPNMDRGAILDDVWEKRRDEISTLVRTGTSFVRSKRELDGSFAEVAWDSDVSQVRRSIAAYGRSFFRIFRSSYRDAVATFRGIVAVEIPSNYHARIALLDELISAQSAHRMLTSDEQVQDIGKRAFGTYWRGIASDWESLQAIDDWEFQGRELKGDINIRQVLGELDSAKIQSDLLQYLKKNLKPVYEAMQQLFEPLNLDVLEAFGVDDLRRVPLAELRTRLSAWCDRTEELSKWVAYDLRCSRLREDGLNTIVEALSRGDVAPQDILDQFELSYYEQLFREVERRYPELAQFDGLTHDQLLSRFKKLDIERVELARVEVAVAHYEGLPLGAGDIGEVGVVRREIEKKRKHLPIRRLLKEAGRAIQAIKPVFMMSPISVAQFLEPGGLEFDLLVIDEASQVKPVDAFGAIARSKQISIVGDDKQLPPTAFFDRLLAGDGDPDDDAFQVRDVESILGLCSAQGVPSRMLEWHYRSRHPSLITVSNHEFYDDRLYVIPHPSQDDEDGLQFRYISNGVYDRGKSRTNVVEARAVAEAVIEHARTSPEKSLGVGTFSVAQREAILDEVELLRKQNPEIEEFFEEGRDERFFVKNLENIQGDQRDVIFISTGYAKDSSGKMRMNFGPLSADGGERRLNVLITRARERCIVFSSITGDDIDLSQTQSRGTKVFKTFLNFAQKGQLDIPELTGRGFDSDFEEEVARALEGIGYTVRGQIGVAGFRVDLAVVDPQRPGRYLLGIECDGASYHSARSARDRDRLRQSLLERRDWIIHRIWSTDWFRRPQEQLKKTVAAIEQAKIEWSKRDSGEFGTRRSSHSTDDSITIVRSEASELDDGADLGELAVPYVQAEFDPASLIGSYTEDIPDLESSRLAKVVCKIVEIEGPIHQDEVARRVASLWGAGRTSRRMSESVRDAVEWAVRKGHLSQDREFVFLNHQTEIPVRSRESVDSSNLRKTENLPPVEIRQAILTIVERHFGVSKDETVTATARLFGFKSTSQQLRGVIEAVIDELCQSGCLADSEGKLSVGKDSQA